MESACRSLRKPFLRYPDIDVLKRNRDLGVTRMTVRLPPGKEGEILPILDRWAKLIPQVRN